MDLNNIVGFKAVDKNGNERQVTVDEMTELVSARIVSAASEISTFAAAAAAGTDEFEDQLPQSDTFSWLRTLDGSKNPTLTSSSAAAKVLGGLFTSLKLFPFMFRGDVNVTSYDETGALDTVIEMGIYKVKPKQGVWGTLVVFNAFDGAGGVVQKLYNATGAKYRVKNSNTDNLWTDWKSF
ncbi:hypothetical protein [Phocaeicola vulgatus]|nr:hypothetical protein [Phocaeicola vulgatus]